MKKIALCLLLFAIGACNNKKEAPDVSKVDVSLVTKRFDEQFFHIDTLKLEQSLSSVQQQYPTFLSLFLQNIVGVDNQQAIKTFYALYKPVFDSAQRIYMDFSPVEKELQQAFKYVKFYFPSYRLPQSLITVIGPMNTREDLARMASGDYSPNFIGPDFIGISLQFYLGANFSLYNTEYFINNVAPLYRS